jgi:uncharacterized protein YaeQ
LALGATIHHFAIQLSDVDRGVYQPLDLKVARHPSESEDHLVTRVLAYCLELAEGIAFSRGGVSGPDEPAIAVRDLTGQLRAWIDVGAPDAARLHKAAKAAPRVAVYTHKAPALMRGLQGERIHRAEAIELYAFDRDLIAGLVARLERRMAFDLSVTDAHLFVSLPGVTLSGEVRRLAL